MLLSLVFVSSSRAVLLPVLAYYCVGMAFRE